MLARNKVSKAQIYSTPHQSTLEYIPLTTRRRRRALGIMSTLLLVILLFAAVRLPAVAHILPGAVSSNDELLVHIGNQQIVTLDLLQSLPISPDLLGANVFPQSGTMSEDNAHGFMDYSPLLTASLTDAHIKLLRFPGGKWGEEHSLSLDQLSAFSTLLVELNADGMVQAQLADSSKDACKGCGLPPATDVADQAAVAGRWVDFLNNPRSDQRIGKYAHVPYHPIKYWTVGDEPDTLINPATRQKYLVKDYVNDFIQFSTVMHKIDPGIKIFGPDISQFYGPGGEPTDARGQLWMEGFLQGVGAYEQAHNVVLLDGVSFHYYPFMNATQVPYSQARDPYMLLTSTGEWNYLLPALHQLIIRDLKRDLPVAVTEINTNNEQQNSYGMASLWWGDTLATLLNQQVEYVAFAAASDMRTPGTQFPAPQTVFPLFAGANQQPTPMFRVMELFSHLQSNLIPLEAQRDPVSVYATQDNAHQKVSLLLINKSNTPQLAQISGGDNQFGIASCTVDCGFIQHTLDVSLAGYSMVVVTLHLGGNAEAYSYIAPVETVACPCPAAPVIHTLCGKKSDPLATTIPC
jgi:glycosyl hydrolase family 44